MNIITNQDILRRKAWVHQLTHFSASFEASGMELARALSDEIKTDGLLALLTHLRLCGAIPEAYEPDSTQEKLYSKYTDTVIHAAFTALGCTGLVLRERGDAADVECVCDEYSFVADAKSFRLSRTAKNQKDFKVQALDNWKYGKPFAMLVCPVYQLPARSSQIYQQAAARSVCIYTYTHLAALVRVAAHAGTGESRALLRAVFATVEAMNPTKDAVTYWQAINKVFLEAGEHPRNIWREEKVAAVESIQIAKQEAFETLALERERILRLSHEEAIQEVLKWRKIESKMRAVSAISDNGIMEME